MNKFGLKIVVIFLGNFLHRLGSMATIPFIVFYMLNHMTHNPIIVGAISSSNILAAAISGVVAGAYIDQYNPRYIFLGALLGLITSSIGFAIAAIHYSSLIGILIADIGIGIFGSIFELAIKVYISTNFPVELRAKAFTFRYSGMNAGSILGPAIGAWFSTNGGVMMFYYTIIMFIIVWIFYFFLLQHHPLQKSDQQRYDLTSLVKIIFAKRAFLLLTLAFFIYYFGYSYIDSVLPMVMRERIINYSTIYANILSINGLIVCILSFVIGFVIHKCDLFKITFYSLVLMCIAFLLFAVANSYTKFYLAIILLSIGEVIYATGVNLHLDKISNNQIPGLFFGVANFALIGAFFGPVVGSTLYKYFGGAVSFTLPSIMILSSIFIYIKIKRLV